MRARSFSTQSQPWDWVDATNAGIAGGCGDFGALDGYEPSWDPFLDALDTGFHTSLIRACSSE